MIFGTPYARRKPRVKQFFAWLPTLLEDGRWAWLETVEAHYWEDPQANWAGDDSGYRYRPMTDANTQ